MDYHKPYDKVKHEKLAEIMETIEMLELERRLITNLYWRQHATVRWNEDISREVKVERG